MTRFYKERVMYHKVVNQLQSFFNPDIIFEDETEQIQKKKVITKKIKTIIEE